MHRVVRYGLLVGAMLCTGTGPACAGSAFSTWLSDSSHHRMLWTVLYVLLGLLVLLVAWEAFFQLMRRRERLQVDLSHGSAPPVESPVSAPGGPARGGMGAGAAGADDDPFKSLLRRSAAAANAEASEERARGTMAGQARGGAVAPRPAAPPPAPEPPPPESDLPVPGAGLVSPTEDLASMDGASGGRKMVRLNLAGESGPADEGAAPEPTVEPRRTVAPASPPRIAITPAPEKAAAGKDAWSDLLKKAPAAPPSPAPVAEESHGDAAGDPWKSLLKKTRDEGASPRLGPSGGRLAGTAPPGARPLPSRASAAEAAQKSSDVPVPPPAPRPPVREVAPATMRVASPDTVSLPAGATRASWEQGLASLQSAVVSPCRFSSGAAAGQRSDRESVGSAAAPVSSEPKRGRRMKLGGSGGDVPSADAGGAASGAARESDPGPRLATPASAGKAPLLVPPTRRMGGESRGEGERAAPGEGLRIVRATRESHGEVEKEIPDLLRNAEESSRPGEVPQGIPKSRAAQGEQTESL